MRCLNCHTVFNETDPYCPVCQKRPARRSKYSGKSKSGVAGLALIFALVGGGVFNVLAPRWFSRPPGGGINWDQVMWAGVVGGLCALLGSFVGMCMGGPDKS
jgi:hypothetical protein